MSRIFGTLVNESYIGSPPMLTAKFAGAFSQANSQSRAAYNTFLTLWKDTDPNIPILKQATTEYAHL